MTYLAVKTLHILAVILWIGSLFLITLITSGSGPVAGKAINAEQLAVARRVTDACIGLTWLAGVVLVVLGSWYLAKWWYIKVVLVIVISAIHSIVHRRWRQQATQTHPAIPWLLLALTLLVVGLAVFKLPS